MNRLAAIAWKELLQLRRDRLTRAMMVLLPVLQLLLFGWAINNDVRHIPTINYLTPCERHPALRNGRGHAPLLGALSFSARGLLFQT